MDFSRTSRVAKVNYSPKDTNPDVKKHLLERKGDLKYSNRSKSKYGRYISSNYRIKCYVQTEALK